MRVRRFAFLFENHLADALPYSRDEFAEVKAVKLLRRGRRLQQVEYVLSSET